MAEMIARRRSGTDARGQMILVTGIVLAVLFVALALLVNAAIYTDNVATRGGDSAGEALEYQSGVVDSVGGLIDAENVDESHSSLGDIETAVEGGTAEISTTEAEMHLRRGAAANVDASTVRSDTTRGILIRQTESDPFDDWAVSDASNVRAFEITFEAGDMDAINLTEEDPFEIDFGGTSLYVYENEDTTDGLVVAESPRDPICTASGSDTVQFDVSGERFGGDPCKFGWPDVTEVAFSNGGNARGTYELTVASSGTDPDTDLPDTVEATEALYSVNALNIRIDTADLSYERTARVAPGEPDV